MGYDRFHITGPVELALKTYRLDPPKLVRGPEEIVGLVRKYGRLEREVMLAVHLMPDLRAYYVQQAGIGGRQSVVFSPHDVTWPAIKFHSAGIVLVHNHPYEDKLVPTNQDKAVTARMYKACRAAHTRLVDHIILGPKSYLSMHKEGVCFAKPKPTYSLKIEDLKVKREILACAKNASVKRIVHKGKSDDQLAMQDGGIWTLDVFLT